MLDTVTNLNTKLYADRKVWFSMWFLGAIVTFGVAFFPMFYRLIEGRNRHLQKEAELEQQVSIALKRQHKETPKTNQHYTNMNAKAWTISIILVIPAFVIVYLLSRDLAIHEENEDAYFATAFPRRIFMPQTIPIKKYALLTIATLGVGGVYWLYKMVNLYNAHFKADLQVEREIAKLLKEEKVVEHM